jgi:hypothetical protein
MPGGTSREQDLGEAAEPEDSGGRFYHLSPGLSYGFGRDVQAYAFYQWAAYQYVKSVQFTSDSTAVAGLSARFQTAAPP